MSFAGYFFIAVGLVIALVCGQKFKPRRVSTLALPALYAVHTLYSLYYWNIATTSVADASFYYAESAYPTPLGWSNEFVIWILYVSRSLFDRISYTSMIDYFMLFNIFGYIGLLYLYKTLMEIPQFERGWDNRYSPWYLLLALACIFSPGLGFWTSAIGKDSLIFLGIAMSVYATFALRRRWLHLALGIGVIIMARPYILVFIMIAGAIQFLIAGKVPFVVRAIGLVAIGVTAFLFGPTIVDFIGIGRVDVEGVSDYVATRQQANMGAGSSVDIASYNIVLQVLTYLFRPFFFDAHNASAMAASMDNALLLFIVLIALANFRFYFRDILKEPAITVNLLFAGVGICALAMTTSNLGIAVRQKTMFLPGLYVFIAWGLNRWMMTQRERRLRRLRHRLA